MTVEDVAQAPPQAALPDRAARASAAPLARTAAWRLDVVLCIALFAIAIIPRAAWVAYNDRAPQGLNDPTLYNFFGDIMADGGGYTRPTGEPFAYYPVGFPATVAGLKK